MNYEQLLSSVFSCFHGQKNIVAPFFSLLGLALKIICTLTPASAANWSMLALLAASLAAAFSASQVGFIFSSYALRSSSIVLSWVYLKKKEKLK